MPPQNDIPTKCRGCAKTSKPFIHATCRLCQYSEFQEELFCELNRSIQNSSSFECHAFQPLLKLVATSGRERRPEPAVFSTEMDFERQVDSDRLKYQRALALQKLAHNPDEVILEIEYHFAWNVIGRRPVFAGAAPMIDFIRNSIMSCSEAVGGFATLLWLAPDHIHIYVESDGEVSPDNMAQQLKRLTEASILERFPDLVASPEMNKRLWDEAYFVGTIG